MSVVKVIEVISEGSTIEAAIASAVAEVSRTVKNVRQVNVDHISASVDERTGKITSYRVNAKVSFVVEHDLQDQKAGSSRAKSRK